MHQPFDALFEFDESAIIGDGDDAPPNLAGHGIFDFHVLPRIRGNLLMAQGDALALLVIFEHGDLDAVPDGEKFARVAHPPPGHIRDVKQAVYSAEVDERSIVGNVLDDAHLLHAFREVRERLALEFRSFILEQHAPGENNVPALSIELDDLHVKGFADKLIEIPHRPQIDLGTRQKGLESDVDRKASLDAGDDHALDNLVVVMGFADLVPYLDSVGFLLREHDEAIVILTFFDENLHPVSRLEIPPAAREFKTRHQTF